MTTRETMETETEVEIEVVVVVAAAGIMVKTGERCSTWQ